MNTLTYLKQWQKALLIEIQHLKKWGSTKYKLTNGNYISHEDNRYIYFFEIHQENKIPNGSVIKLEWGKMIVEGRMMSTEGNSVIISLEKHIGDLISKAFLVYDPWELLMELKERLEDIKESKKKRGRIKRLMDPSMDLREANVSLKTNVEKVYVRSKNNPVTFVWGPPGTGKTYTLARVAANYQLKGKKVLLLSHSNQAVDVLIGEIAYFLNKKKLFKKGTLIRYGSPGREFLEGNSDLTTSELLEKDNPALIMEKLEIERERKLLKTDLSSSFSKRDTEDVIHLEKKLGRVLEKIRQKEIELLKDASIIGTTLAKAATDSSIYEKEFDVIIIDEASMAYIPQIAFATSLGKKVIVCGDFKQLPPIAQARHPLVDQWLKDDIFHSTGVIQQLNNGMLHPHLFLLDEQRRMHPDISSFTNRHIYHSLVKDYPKMAEVRGNITEKEPFTNHASILVDTSFTGAHCITENSSNSRINVWQLLISFQVIHEAYISGIRSIGYTTPYRAQAQLMESLLSDIYEDEKKEADIIAATVHKFQGSERDLMVFDTVDSSPQTRAGMLLIGKESERLLNVAITRTKGKYVHVSNEAFIKRHIYKDKLLRKLVDHQRQNNKIIQQKDIGTWIKHQHPRLLWMHARKTERIWNDIKKARQSIVVCLPPGTSFPADWIQEINSLGNGVNLTVISEQVITEISPTEVILMSFPFPFIIIDHRYLWLGLLFEGVRNIQPPYVSIRLDSNNFINKWKNMILQED